MQLLLGVLLRNYDKRVVVELQPKQVLLFLDVSQAFDKVWHSTIRITLQNQR